jgi:hypothetical protein
VRGYEKAWRAVLQTIDAYPPWGEKSIVKKYGNGNASRIKKRLSRAVEFIMLLYWLYEYGWPAM